MPEARSEGRQVSETQTQTQAQTRTAGQQRLWQVGRSAWATAGIVVVAAGVLYVVSLVSLLVVSVVLALFPATLLAPVADRLRRARLPDAAAALLAIVLGIGLVAGVLGAMVPVVAKQVPELVESATEGIADIEAWLDTQPFGIEVGGLTDLAEAAQQQVGDLGAYAGQAAGAAYAAFEILVGLLLLFVVLFFYLKDGRRLRDGLVATVPARGRARTRQALDRAWDTLGKYFRGQLLVALVDAVFIGIGLVVLGVPLALVVQQLEGNVLEPLILGRAIRLHQLVVLLSITAGSLLLGILGAFLAVPVAAIVARILDDVRAGPPPVVAIEDGVV